MANEQLLPIVRVSRNGPPHVLERLLQEGGDPNSDDGYGGTCLMASACFGQHECARLLIQYGADATYAYHGDNATLLYMMALVFSGGEEVFNEGDYILTADILINAGAPIDERGGGEYGLTALELLHEMQVAPGTPERRERDGLISLLLGQYWRSSGHRNPFLHASSPQNSVLLFVMGAANSSDDGSVVDSTRVRSIPPNSRHSVLQALYDHEATFRAFMLCILFVVQQQNETSSQQHPLRLFHEMQESILARVAAFAGVSGRPLANVRSATMIIEELIDADEQEDLDVSHDEDDEDTRAWFDRINDEDVGYGPY